MPTAVAPEYCYEGNPGKFAGGGGYYACLNNGFTPRAKVVFLAACGIDAKFLAGWHLAPQGQALIVPQYAPGNVQEDLNLRFASQEWQAMLVVLANGSTVDQAVAQGKAQAVRDGANYTWTIAPGGDGSVNFRAKTAQ